MSDQPRIRWVSEDARLAFNRLMDALDEMPDDLKRESVLQRAIQIYEKFTAPAIVVENS